MTTHFPLFVPGAMPSAAPLEVHAAYDQQLIGRVDVGGIPYTFHEMQIEKMFVGMTA